MARIKSQAGALSATLTNPWLLGSAALLLAVGGGYGLAKLTASDAPAAEHADEKGEEHAEEGEHAEGEAQAEGTEHAEGEEGIVMDAARVTAAGIQVQPVSAAGLAGEVITQASVEATPEGQAVLTARAAGSVTRIFKRLGDPVRAGESVATVQSAEAATITADRRVAAARVTAARQRAQRERRLFEQKVSPRQDYETAQAELVVAEAEAGRASATAAAAGVSGDGRSVVVSSPISGRVTASSASLGAYVQPETELFRVADPSRIQIEAAVTAADAQRIRPGDPATLETGQGAFAAVVRAVTPGINEETRSATVVLSASGSVGNLQPGQLIRARIAPRLGTSSGIVVPEEAVQTVEGRPVVFVRTQTGFRPQQVALGQRSGGRVAILSGLQPGQSVAVKGSFLLKAELGKGEAEHDH